jgi:hypothetical protein
LAGLSTSAANAGCECEACSYASRLSLDRCFCLLSFILYFAVNRFLSPVVLIFARPSLLPLRILLRLSAIIHHTRSITCPSASVHGSIVATRFIVPLPPHSLYSVPMSKRTHDELQQALDFTNITDMASNFALNDPSIDGH